MLGRIVAISCGVYSIYTDGLIYKSSPRGLFRLKKVKPVVGDLVEFDDSNGVIQVVHDRTSYLKRPVIANIDQIFIVLSLVEPEFSYLLAFKYLTYANLNGIKCSLILTKKDKNTNLDTIDEIEEVFKTMNIDVHVLSNKSKEGVDEIVELMKNKVTCLMGQTGVGKSSLINNLDERFNREIGEYSRALGRGKHQTKEIILLPFEDGFIADTPGFSSLDLDLYKEDLAKYFPSFDKYYTDCYFSDCLHISESKCAVKKAKDENKIPQIAYDCYRKLSDEAVSIIRGQYKWEKF